jgi:hypothetical protein
MNKKTYAYTGVIATFVGVAGMVYAAQDDLKSVFRQLPVVGGMI